MHERNEPIGFEGGSVSTGLLWVALVIGLIPFIGVALGSTWNQIELALAVLLVIFPIAGLVAERRARRRPGVDRDDRP